MTTDIRHRIGINAPQPRVHHALTTLDGLGTWWTRDVEGDPGQGGKVTFWFGRPDRFVTMAVEQITSDRVQWRAVEGPDEWLDTTFTFDLDHADGETVVLFTNAGWRQPVPFQAHCTTKWGFFLLGLKAGLEGGEATPYPGELQISRWG